MDNVGVGISMDIRDFMFALADEAAEPMAEVIAGDAGNPFLLMTTAQLKKRLVSSVESDSVRQVFEQAAEKIFSAMKAETAKVV